NRALRPTRTRENSIEDALRRIDGEVLRKGSDAACIDWVHWPRRNGYFEYFFVSLCQMQNLRTGDGHWWECFDKMDDGSRHKNIAHRLQMIDHALVNFHRVRLGLDTVRHEC